MNKTLFPEFPDYDDADLVIPDNWIDISYHNDICPSISRPVKPNLNLVIFCDFKNPERRLDGQGSTNDATRFYLSLEKKDGIGEMTLFPVNEFFTLNDAVIFADSLSLSL